MTPALRPTYLPRSGLVYPNLEGRMTGTRATTGWALVAATAIALAGCGNDGDAEVRECTPENACTCTDGVERDLSCSCTGGSTCSIDGDDIEFACDGNAACGLVCGANCLITCPGTTSCTVDTGDDGVVSCPGTAFCDITCREDCTVDIAGTAEAIVTCELEAEGAVCDVVGCNLTDCGGGVYACRTECPVVPPADGGI